MKWTAIAKGSRVRLSDSWLTMDDHRRRYASHVGTVVSDDAYSENTECVRVKWDHLKTVQRFHRDFVEAIAPPSASIVPLRRRAK